MTSPRFQDLVTLLTDDQTPRVWSLLVSVFGELAQDAGAQISGTLLGQLTAKMGIKPEAMRVALHRLRKDGWVQSERSGRTSTYALTEWGRAQSAQASPVIYNQRPIPDRAWLIVCDPNQPVRNEGAEGVWIAGHLLITTTAQGTGFAIPLPADKTLPDWMTHRVCDPVIVQMTADCVLRFCALEAAIKAFVPLDSLEIATLRILVVDRWRRIALKTPLLPDHVFPADWAGAPCRAVVARLLDTLQKQSLRALDLA